MIQNKQNRRGTTSNPGNRFEKTWNEPDPESELKLDLNTQFYTDSSKTIIASNKSPDIGFDVSINPYRGCEHGCIYCYARPSHEFLGFSVGLDFETKIMVKEKAPELLEKELSSPNWKPQVLAMSGVTDCYQPAEAKYKLTRACLEVLLKFRNPTTIITKNALILRDIDILSQMAGFDCIAVNISLTTLNQDLALKMEPRTATPRQRLEAIRKLTDAGIPVGVLAAPMIPGLNDVEMPAIIKAAAKAGAQWVHYTALRLPFGVKDLFTEWLYRNYPSKKDKIIDRIKDLRDGKMNDAKHFRRFEGQGIWAKELEHLYRLGIQSSGLKVRFPSLTTKNFKSGNAEQLSLF